MSYNHKEIEEKWQRFWEENQIYKFDWNNLEKAYIIDTPPPYPTGEIHLGHVLNWVYIDIVARYKRMRGFNVLFPQGWDCHGLPTEVKVEEKYNIRKRDIPREKFRELCVKLTRENINRMRAQLKRLGFSIDWSFEYITMEPYYIKLSQLAFIKMYKQGLIYRGEHPVFYCPRCETVIAQAEVEYDERETYLNYIKFLKEDGDYVIIATTRPELLAACVAVAVHPRDERYKDLIGKNLIVPIYNRKVKVIADEDVDPNFGTGVVMICTFGDKQDVLWVKRHNLNIINILNTDGTLNEIAGKYKGLYVEDARKKIIEDLEKEGYLIKKERIKQRYGKCWRCKTPVEIIVTKQYFVNVRKLKDKILEAADKMKWYPEHMKIRLKNWVESMIWDWVISRQRIFATPIPIWYCKKCGETIIAEEDELPVFPEKQSPKNPCPKCGSKEFIPETDVMDTWMDSSITPLFLAGWPNLNEKIFPVDLRPQGHDIIRTWIYYTIVKSVALVNKEPFKEILINGMVLGEDGRKMSKSLGNYVEVEPLLEKYGADAVRQWAALATIGEDYPFSLKDVIFGYRFLVKLYNAFNFASKFIPYYDFNGKLNVEDLWILYKLNKLIIDVTNDLENYNFSSALQRIHNFAWHDFCDFYLEEIKHRLYNPDKYGYESMNAARFTLTKIVYNLLKLLSPFIPHFTEEFYQKIFSKGESIHKTKWPEPERKYLNEEYLKRGELLNRIISMLRKYKTSRKISLAEELKRVIIITDNNLEDIVDTIKGTIRIKELIVTKENKLREVVDEIKLNIANIGKRYKKDTKKILEYISKNKERIYEMYKMGEIVIEIDGKNYKLEKDDIKEIKRRFYLDDKEVEVIEEKDFIIIVEK